MQITRVDVRRALPKNADDIARLLNQASGKTLTRMDVIMAFGQKSYWLAEFDGHPIGLTGFQVDNLITRMDEMVIIPEAPVAPVAEALIGAIEEASKELESEVVFSFLPNGSSALEQTFVDQGYEKITVDSIKVPAWREAATESQPPNTQIYKKQLRERVLKPI
jgi:N-acetylglutamate synthase-like GNAT family acetyltransferase